MRIIAGKDRGRRILSPIGRDTRPTSDRVKEALFNILASNVPEAKVLDIFAGTGNLGLEALSRGAVSGIFIDNSREIIKLIHQNIKLLNYEKNCEVYNNDVSCAIEVLSRRSLKFNIIFCDPPYHKNIIPVILKNIAVAGILENDGVIATEHDISDLVPDNIDGLLRFKYGTYGDTVLSFYKKVL